MVTKYERKILKSVSEALLPGSENLPIPAGQIGGFDKDVEEFVGYFPSYSSAIIRLSLFLIQLSPILRKGFPTLFTELSMEDRLRQLERLNDSPFYLLRGLMVLLKSPILLNYSAREEVKDAVDYHVDCVNVKKNPTPKLMEKNIHEYKTLKEKIFEINCDVLVVGSGAGGAVAADGPRGIRMEHRPPLSAALWTSGPVGGGQPGDYGRVDRKPGSQCADPEPEAMEL